MTNFKSNSGFTLLEILIVAGIIVIISVPLSMFQRDVLVQNEMVQSGALAEEGVRTVLRKFGTELRTAAPA
ncbi:MAG: prepilin-type N-terminal cleavage/methylation domain-containing protein, partial [Patescibacteria group bacterium]